MKTISRPIIRRLEDGSYKIEIFDKELNSGYLISIGGYDNHKVGYVHRIDVHRFDEEVCGVNLESGKTTKTKDWTYAITKKERAF